MNRELMKKVTLVLQVAFARLRFLAVFLIAGLIVGYWDNLKNHVDKWTRPPVAPDELAHAAASDIEYYCPMHPDVVREEPGQCPKCGMPLVKRQRGAAVKLPADVLARVQLTPQRIALANVHTTPIEYRSLQREVRALGVLDYDETKLARLSARVSGRADELYVAYTGQQVQQGDPIYALYSPDVYTAQREYFLARKRVNELPKNAGEDAKMDASAVYNASLQKLVLWGITTDQLNKFDEEFDRTGKIPDHLIVTSPIGGIVVRKDINQGQYVQVGESPYTVADLSTLWLQLKLYERDVPLVRIGNAVQVQVEAFPDQPFQGKVTFIAFQLDPETRTLDARVQVDNPDLRIRPGMFATANVRVPITGKSDDRSPARPTSKEAKPFAREASSAPAARDSGKQLADGSAIFADALPLYLQAHELLSHDKLRDDSGPDVPSLLKEAMQKLEPLRDEPTIHETYQRLSTAIEKLNSQDIEQVRAAFKDVSAAMVNVGKVVGVKEDAKPVQVFYCSMKKAQWLQIGDQTANPYYGSKMFNCGNAVEPLPKATRSATTPSATKVATMQTAPQPLAAVYQNALGEYLKAQALLAADKSDGVADALAQLNKHLEPVSGDAAVASAFREIADAAAASKGQSIQQLRQSFQRVSASMINIGKKIGTNADAPAVRVFHCPMKNANWLQVGEQTANPYYGAEMLTCGSAVEALPKAARVLPPPEASMPQSSPQVTPRPNASSTPPASQSSESTVSTVLAVPRSAVIDTGANKIVYVESSPGVFDMHAVTLGQLAGDYYPVFNGLNEGDRVVTIGTFLIDAENRLNPMKVSEAGSEAEQDRHKH